MQEEIDSGFFLREPVVCARELIGCVFYWKGCAGRIVETEAYAEKDDPASHTWNRSGARDFVTRYPAGTAYVYLNYGVHWLFNILAKGGDGSGFVLFRALEPLAGVDMMRARRGDLKVADLCSGPGKLTKAFGIDGTVHGTAFLGSGGSGLYRGAAPDIRAGVRIGISRAVERPWRFGAAGSPALSRKF